MSGEGNKQFSDNTQRQVQALTKLVQPYAELIQKINAQMKPYNRIVEQVRKQNQTMAKMVQPYAEFALNMNTKMEPCKRIVEQVRKQNLAMVKLVEPFAELTQKMNAQMVPHKRILEQVRKQMEAIATIAEPIEKSMVKMLATFKPIDDMIRRFISQQVTLEEDYRKAQTYLFDEGWYLGGDMPIPNYGILAKMVDEDRHTDIEEVMCEWVRTKIDEIINGTMKAFEDRAQILKNAADAHRDGKYSLSIPVFFAQSDGMAEDIIGNGLFSGYPTRALEKKLAQFGEFPLSGFSDILLDPLRSISFFYKVSPKKVLKCGRTSANRSKVLHGSQLDYASEANSLRVIVLLGYLVGVKSLLDTHTDEVAEIREELKKAMASD